MLDGPGGTGCNVPVRGCWVSRDVIDNERISDYITMSKSVCVQLLM